MQTSKKDTTKKTKIEQNPTPIPAIDEDAELYSAIEAATTITALKAALLGGMNKSKVKVKATK